jgi:hypothetical protein
LCLYLSARFEFESCHHHVLAKHVGSGLGPNALRMVVGGATNLAKAPHSSRKPCSGGVQPRRGALEDVHSSVHEASRLFSRLTVFARKLLTVGPLACCQTSLTTSHSEKGNQPWYTVDSVQDRTSLLAVGPWPLWATTLQRSCQVVFVHGLSLRE